MADQAKIDLVTLNLPPWREESGMSDWSDAKVSKVLDTLSGNVNSAVRQFWLDRVNITSALTDVADVGASRPLSQTYQHAQEMLRYWDRVAGTGGEASLVVNIKRRYKKRHAQGLNSYGGVYVRSD